MNVIPQIIRIWLLLWFGHFGLRSPISVPSTPSAKQGQPVTPFRLRARSVRARDIASILGALNFLKIDKYHQGHTIFIDSESATTRYSFNLDTMALLQRQTGSVLSRVLFGSPSTYTTTQSSLPVLTSITLPSISISVPGFLSDIWEGILRAVPKKKTSHMKKRHRQLAGKALKDVKAVCSCPGCGRPKKAHFLCPYCVAGKSCTWKHGRILTACTEIKQSYMDRRLDGASSASTTQQKA